MRGRFAVGDDDDLLVAFHGRCGLGEVGPRRTAVDLLLAAFVGDETLGAPGDLGNDVGAEMPDQLVERRRHRRQRAKLLDQAVTCGHGFGADAWAAILGDRRPRALEALVVDEHVHRGDRKGVEQIVDDVLPRRQFDFEIGAFVGRQVGKTSAEHRLRRRH